MTRIFVAGFTALTIASLAACTQDRDSQKKPKPHKYGDSATEFHEETPPQPSPTPTPEPQSTPPVHTEVKSPTTNAGEPKKGEVPYATPVPGKAGFVTSPFAPYSGYVDVRGFPPGTEVKCPYTGKIFLVP